MKIKWESSDKYLVGGIVMAAIGSSIPVVGEYAQQQSAETQKKTLIFAGLVGVVVGVAKSESIGDAIWFFLL